MSERSDGLAVFANSFRQADPFAPIGGSATHMFSRPTNQRYHPAGLILSTLGAIPVLYVCYKLKIHFPQIELIER